ncbi:hypothetical protein GCM10009815_08530 [Nocardioides marmoribigeumensis]
MVKIRCCTLASLRRPSVEHSPRVRTPPGAPIGVSTYWIDSRRILAALTRAHRRGVVVRVVVGGSGPRGPPGQRVPASCTRRPTGSRGSDNWTDSGAGHDQAVLGVRDDRVHADVVQGFEDLAVRPGGVLGEACPADLDP